MAIWAHSVEITAEVLRQTGCQDRQTVVDVIVTGPSRKAPPLDPSSPRWTCVLATGIAGGVCLRSLWDPWARRQRSGFRALASSLRRPRHVFTEDVRQALYAQASWPTLRAFNQIQAGS